MSSAGRSIPFSYTCTCSGRPLSGSTQTSTRPTDDASSFGTRRSPRASWPDTLRAPIRVSSSSVASDSRRRPSEVGSRSDGAGSANGVDSARVAVARSYSQVQVPHSSWWVLVSPAAVMTSTRWSVGPRHQTRISVRSLNRSATEVSWSVTGSSNPPADSAYPENPTSALPRTAARRSAADTSASEAGSAPISGGVATSTATRAPTIPQRRAAPWPRARIPETVRRSAPPRRAVRCLSTAARAPGRRRRARARPAS